MFPLSVIGSMHVFLVRRFIHTLTHIPYVEISLFLGIVSIACSRLLLHLRDATSPHSVISLSGRDVVFNKSEPIVFNHSEAVTTDEPDTTCASADIEEA
jgi:hypothetical protein